MEVASRVVLLQVLQGNLIGHARLSHHLAEPQPCVWSSSYAVEGCGGCASQRGRRAGPVHWRRAALGRPCRRQRHDAATSMMVAHPS